METFSPAIALYSLLDDDEWTEFDNRMTFGCETSIAPWHRVLSVLRSQEAKICVVEENYVCLDYRSEVATFYSQLENSLNSKSIRLHFFSRSMTREEIFRLQPEQVASYLGYVVCRSGGLPLVGRTVIQTPEYIQVSASIEETVYFFGQRLSVWGIPFMQQDDRFAVCAQVAAWEAHYSAYRRGLVERRLIADFVASSQKFRPMRPSGQRALVAHQVADVLRETGLRAEVWFTPQSPSPFLPPLRIDSVPGAREIVDRCVATLASRALGEGLRLERGDLSDFAIDYMFAMSSSNTSSEPPAYEETSALQDLVIAQITLPYIRSRWPVYCDTEDHALLLCGISQTEDGYVFFFHDDQYGPYLASRYAFFATKGDFQFQAGVVDESGNDRLGALERDVAKKVISRDVEINSGSRGIHSLVVACPPRMLLSPGGAEEAARALMTSIGIEKLECRVTMVMGTDYKDERLRELRSAETQASDMVALFSSMHLAEWVAVVEGLDAHGVVGWEAVYDGSSGSSFPLLQFARFDRNCVYVPPGRDQIPQKWNATSAPTFHAILVPSRLGKGRRSGSSENGADRVGGSEVRK